MSKRVLVVDDTQFMRMMLKNTLGKMGLKDVVEAENGLQAVKKYQEYLQDGNAFELVLMDITMPDMDGITALKKIVEMDKNAAVIMCSALGNNKHVIESFQIGAKDFVVKPFQEDEVISKIRDVLNIE
ncbi:chemotaxis protein CheY [Bacillus cereus]|uniref:Chemotaxis regulator-transmits chemoreceptor signals to flagelllar motor components CheY n=1 Tax=Bacillus cereus TaxID=1396 RepID=A0A164QRI8_BACCE|nr:response regulator [Bacillus cereus]KZD72078.1 Chemotaxis regulator - transmits chemoreceptor signals to flagelllar motor components CheY [Bacillus cereus]GCF70896.1 chemotaxis protein CheY [Bacillus cereus]HDR8321101.1 response regulator [Bacillus cereus]HDR8327272.1 response regulator [Bacillus cereus]HDR8333012.1 response regulator [Bacillus cereus]